MTTAQIIAVAVAWAVATAGLYAASRWGARKWRARRKPVEWTVDDGIVTFDRHITNAEMEAFKAEWKQKYGGGRAHEVRVINEKEQQ